MPGIKLFFHQDISIIHPPPVFENGVLSVKKDGVELGLRGENK